MTMYRDTPNGQVALSAEEEAEVRAGWEAQAQEAIQRRVGTAREFLKLFTEAEQLAFFTAKASNPVLDLWWADASSGNSFSLDHPSVAVGLAGLVAAEILTQARADEIAAADFDAVSAE